MLFCPLNIPILRIALVSTLMRKSIFFLERSLCFSVIDRATDLRASTSSRLEHPHIRPLPPVSVVVSSTSMTFSGMDNSLHLKSELCKHFCHTHHSIHWVRNSAKSSLTCFLCFPLTNRLAAYGLFAALSSS